MEQENKEREEREKLLAKIKDSINKNPKPETKPKLKATTPDEEIDRDKIIEQSKSNIDFEKVKKAKNLYEVFEDEGLKIERRKNQANLRRTRANINLGNVYNSTHF